MDFMMENTGIGFNSDPNNTWKSLRKATHQHLKQFGSGMTRIEGVVNDVLEDMLKAFNQVVGQAFDPFDVISQTAFNTIAFLIIGERMPFDHPIMEKMRFVERFGPEYIGSQNMKYFIYDLLPSLRHMRLEGWKDIERVINTEETLWQDIARHTKENSHLDSFVNSLMKYMVQSGKTTDTDGKTAASFGENDVRKTTFALLIAGVLTTSLSFYEIVNILAHRTDIQMKISQEIDDSVGRSNIKLADKANLPYTQAFILEALRYTSILSLGLFHRTLDDVTLEGVPLPRDTPVIVNLWALHHDDQFWHEPFSVLPERFLDESGCLVAADHPNRRHLMPFGAGLRVCIGESLAMARLFLWTASLVQHFVITPSEDNKPETFDPRNFPFKLMIQPSRYKILVNPR